MEVERRREKRTIEPTNKRLRIGLAIPLTALGLAMEVLGIFGSGPTEIRAALIPTGLAPIVIAVLLAVGARNITPSEGNGAPGGDLPHTETIETTTIRESGLPKEGHMPPKEGHMPPKGGAT